MICQVHPKNWLFLNYQNLQSAYFQPIVELSRALQNYLASYDGRFQLKVQSDTTMMMMIHQLHLIGFVSQN